MGGGGHEHAAGEMSELSQVAGRPLSRSLSEADAVGELNQPDPFFDRGGTYPVRRRRGHPSLKGRN